jgi:hypothetical protein
MKPIDSHTANGDTPLQINGVAEQKCFICGKALGDAWFCRIPHDGKRIVLCSPFCAHRYFDSITQRNSRNEDGNKGAGWKSAKIAAQ